VILLDTMVVSQLFKSNPAPEARAFFHDHRLDELYLSVLTIGEIVRGVESVGAKDPQRARALRNWLDGIGRQFAGRVLPVSVPIAQNWGHLTARLGRKDVDLLIAATALEHGMALATRNERHFAPAGVRLLNPWRP